MTPVRWVGSAALALCSGAGLTLGCSSSSTLPPAASLDASYSTLPGDDAPYLAFYGAGIEGDAMAPEVTDAAEEPTTGGMLDGAPGE